MKNKNFGSEKNFTKKWFYIAVAFGVVFTIITTIVAICKNISSSKEQNEYVVPTETKKDDVKKDMPSDLQIYDTESNHDNPAPTSEVEKPKNEEKDKKENKKENKKESSKKNKKSDELKKDKDVDEDKIKDKEKDNDKDKIKDKEKDNDKDKAKQTQAALFGIAKENKKTDQSEKDVDKNKNDAKDDKEKKEKKNTITKFLSPVKGEIINQHSNDNLVFCNTLNDWRTHDGVDVSAKPNTPVKAVSNGTVTDVTQEDGTWGTCVTITHEDGRFKSIYKGLNNQVQVKPDQNIKAGKVIGSVGEDNVVESDKASHLHFGLQQKLQPDVKDSQEQDRWEWVDPLKYISFK